MPPKKGRGKPAVPEQLDLNARIEQVRAKMTAIAEDRQTVAKKGPRVYSVGDLIRLVSRRIESQFGEVWVEGEVSNLKSPVSGHLYFTLKDRRAQLAAVMFRSSARRLKFRIEDGQTLRCRGRLAIYEVQGRFQLTVESCEPTGLGALQLAFEQLKAKLEKEGLFDARHKKPLPLLPRRIAVVTSRTGAALRDILRVLDARFPVHVTVCPTSVQGSESSFEIASALRAADRLDVDLVIVGRGGGSLEDLWAFNTEGVARAIFSMETPVISAVGHEVDLTISDLVADARAPTPSAAAEQAVPIKAELQQALAQTRQRLARGLTQRLRIGALALERLRGRLGTPRDLVNRGRLRLDDATVRLEAALRRQLRARRTTLDAHRLAVNRHHPKTRLVRDRAALSDLRTRLHAALRRRLEADRATLARQAAQLDALSPLAVLARGYSLVHDRDAKVLRDAADVAPGDALKIRLHRGSVAARVEETTPED